jgi:hypothetical protein
VGCYHIRDGPELGSESLGQLVCGHTGPSTSDVIPAALLPHLSDELFASLIPHRATPAGGVTRLVSVLRGM